MIVVHLAASSSLGGPESQILGMIGGGAEGPPPAVLSFSEGGRCRPLLAEASARGAVAVELERNAPDYRAAACEVAGHLRRLGAGVLCCHGYKPDILGLIAARRARVPVVSISHGWTAATVKVRLNEAIDRLCLHGMDRVVCVSEAQARRVRRLGIASRRIVVIHNAIDPERHAGVDPGGRQRLLALFDEPPGRLVGAAGRLSPEKGYGDFVEAAAALAREQPDMGFIQFGEGPLRGALTRRVERLGLGRRFVFAGFQTDLHRVFRHLDLFVLPSYTEGLPVVILEAFASGVPVVATAVGGTPEVVADGVNGRLVRAGDTPGLARAIAEILADAEKARAWGRRGQNFVLKRFTFTEQGLAYRRLFDELARPRWRADLA
jgi:glycosyltransferase involved in cell wall biosynthesis